MVAAALVRMMLVEEKPACRTANAKTAVGVRNLGSSRGQSPGEDKEHHEHHQPGTHKKQKGVCEYVGLRARPASQQHQDTLL